MSQPAHIAERHARILGDLADRGHSLACKLHDGAMAAEDPESCARIAAGFHQVARTVRQTLALEAKLERDAQRAQREVLRDEEHRRERAVSARKAQVRAKVERTAWDEADPDETHRLLDALDVLLAEDAADPAFLDRTIDAYIEDLRHDLGLGPDDETKPPPRGRFKRVVRGAPHWMWEPRFRPEHSVEPEDEDFEDDDPPPDDSDDDPDDGTEPYEPDWSDPPAPA